jgi:hypothetical protein
MLLSGRCGREGGCRVWIIAWRHRGSVAGALTAEGARRGFDVEDPRCLCAVPLACAFDVRVRGYELLPSLVAGARAVADSASVGHLCDFICAVRTT